MSIRAGKVVLPILILAAAFAVTAFMMAHRITPDRLEVAEKVVPVEVVEIARSREQVVVSAQGTVTAAQQVQVRPEVSGRIVELSPSLVPGGRFSAGETLARIDERDYRLQLVARREAVVRARLALREERARQAVAEEEWELLEGSNPADASQHELALRIPQVEQAESAVAAAEGVLARAELDLERCTLTAPFDAVVLREQVDLGQLVGPQSEIATLVGTDAYWVQVSLPVEHLEWIELPGRRGRASGGTHPDERASGATATVIHRAGAVEIRRQGRVERLLGDVDPAGRMARLLIVVDDPLAPQGAGGGSDLPLLIGSYVTAEIHGRAIDDAIVIPRRALREIHPQGSDGAREGLWIMDADDRLAVREAEVVWRGEETVIVADGLAEGERLITSSLSTPIVGTRLTLAKTAAEAGGGGGE